MSDRWSRAIKEAYAAAPSDTIILHTLELHHPAFSTPLRVVRDHQDLTATLEADAPVDGGQAVLFVAFPFDFRLPPRKRDGGPQELEIVIDSVDRQIIAALEDAVTQPHPIIAYYRPYLSTDLSQPHMIPPLRVQLRDVRVDVMRVTARARPDDYAQMPFPGELYTPERFPGLLR